MEVEKTLLSSIDARTRLAGSNKLELLLFKLVPDELGQPAEVFGINVFKVQEVIMTPPITAIPDAPAFVVGMASLRGSLVTIINLAEYCGKTHNNRPPTMIIAEFSRHIVAFLVHGVETIVRMDWAEVKEPPAMLGGGSKVTAVTQLPDGRLVSILDVEQIVQSITAPGDLNGDLGEIPIDVPPEIKVLYADDSAVARGQLKRVLDALAIRSEETVNGAEAWRRLEVMASAAAAVGKELAATVPIVITDLEMPEMDGFTLIRLMREDRRFENVKIFVHSSMSNGSNLEKARSMGANGFLAKFSAPEVAEQLRVALKDVIASRPQALPLAA